MSGVLYDLSGLLALFFAGSIVLTPLLGLTLRFALKPLIESVARLQGSSRDDDLRLLTRRVEALENELEMTQRALGDVRAASDFDRRLNGPGQNEAP